MVAIIAGRLLALERDRHQLKDNEKLYRYAVFETQRRQRKVSRFYAFDDMERSLAVGMDGVFAFSQILGFTELMAVRGNGRSRVASAFRLSLASVFAGYAAASILFFICGPLVVFTLVTMPVAGYQRCAARGLRRSLVKAGFDLGDPSVAERP